MKIHAVVNLKKTIITIFEERRNLYYLKHDLALGHQYSNDDDDALLITRSKYFQKTLFFHLGYDMIPSFVS